MLSIIDLQVSIGWSNQCEIYDPTSDTWSDYGDLLPYEDEGVLATQNCMVQVSWILILIELNVKRRILIGKV